jgi:leucyl/phenylalanyl-tRNA--protein transferase
MIPWLTPGEPYFPDTRHALDDPNGLLAAGGELTAEWLKAAYPLGIFPWFSEEDPILWWSPSPRCVLYPCQFHQSKSLKKRLRKEQFSVRVDTQFEEVMKQCAAPRGEDGTWISDQIIAAYSDLHRQGVAHSVEVYQGNRLVGGLYGLAIGQIFFGESMFSRVTDASKVATKILCAELEKANYAVIDCQIYNPHLASLGAVEIERNEFEQLLTHCKRTPSLNPWAKRNWYPDVEPANA